MERGVFVHHIWTVRVVYSGRGVKSSTDGSKQSIQTVVTFGKK